MKNRNRSCALGALALVGCLLACGADEQAEPTGPRISDLDEPVAERPEGAANRAPWIESVALRPARPRPGDTVKAVVDVSDPDGDPVQIGYRWSLAGRRLADAGPEIALSNARRGASLEVTVTASDGRDESAPESAVAVVDNRAPRLRSVRIEPQAPLVAGAVVRAVPDAADPDGDPLEFEFSWRVNDREVAEGESHFSTSGLRRGDRVRVRVDVSDGQEWSDSVESHELQVENAPPAFLSVPAGVEESGIFRYTPEAEDPDGDAPLRYRLVTAPAGMTLDPVDGAITWQPKPDQAGEHAVEIEVDDRHGGRTSQHFKLAIAIDPPQTAELSD